MSNFIFYCFLLIFDFHHAKCKTNLFTLQSCEAQSKPSLVTLGQRNPSCFANLQYGVCMVKSRWSKLFVCMWSRDTTTCLQHEDDYAMSSASNLQNVSCRGLTLAATHRKVRLLTLLSWYWLRCMELAATFLACATRG